MKKLAAILALVLCLMAAAPAMAEVKMIQLAVKDAELSAEAYYAGEKDDAVARLVISQISLEGVEDDYVYAPDDANTARPDWNTFTEFPKNPADMMIQELQEALGARSGDTVYYVFFEAEAEVYEEDMWKSFFPEPGYVSEDRYVVVTYPYTMLSSKIDNVAAVNAHLKGALDGNQNVVWSWDIQNVKAENNADKNGVELTHGRLSPVMIGWIEKPDPKPVDPPEDDPKPVDPPKDAAVENLPATGDDSHLAMLFVLLAASVAALAIMRTRRSEN